MSLQIYFAKFVSLEYSHNCKEKSSSLTYSICEMTLADDKILILNPLRNNARADTLVKIITFRKSDGWLP